MILADEIKNEINIEEVFPNLRDVVKSQIKNEGRFCVICDTHIRDNNIEWAIEYKYWKPLEDWAKKEGLNCYCKCNSYGVKHLIITL